MRTIDTERIKKNVNLIDLAGRFSTLRRESATEMGGPCPKCGGDDRFHVKDDMFFCRQCYPLGNALPHDAIAFVQWVGMASSFLGAVDVLAGGVRPADGVQPVTPKKRRNAEKISPAKAKLIAETAQAALLGSKGGAGRYYLVGRGLWPETWEVFGLGYAMVWQKFTRDNQPAICIPYRLGNGQVTGVSYRFLSPHAYTGADGKERTHKTVSEPGSDFSGRLFGGCALSGPGNVPALVLCEGEINAISIWQTTAGAVDVLSLGSQTRKLTPAAIRAIQCYKKIIVWADETEIARTCMRSLPGAVGFRSPSGKDANDWLQAGHLAEIVSELLEVGR